MADRLILHVGPHKTGSTALQNMFAVNSGALARFGIHYPMTGRDGAAQQDIARACWVENSPVLADLTKEIESRNVVLISSELISGLEENSLARLKTALGETPVEIIYFLRRLPNLLVSHWQELVKHGQWFSFDEYLDNTSLDHDRPSLKPPLPMQQLGRLCEAFGADSLRIMVYDARVVEDEDFGRSFVDDVFGIGQEDGFSTAKLNVTAPDWQVELGRHLNILGRNELNYPARLSVRQKLFERINGEKPDWVTAFAADLNAVDPIPISDQTPWIAQEQARVVDTYAPYIVDPLETYLAPTVRNIRQLHPDALNPDLKNAMNELYQELVADL